MSLFKEKRILLLAGVSLIAVVLLVTPGIRYGIDIAGGSRVTIALNACEVKIRFSSPIVGDNFAPANEIATLLADNLLTSVKPLEWDRNYDTPTFVYEIGRPIRAEVIAAIIGGRGEILSVEEGKVSEETREEVKSLLLARVDPQGLGGIQSRLRGADRILFEVPTIDPNQSPEWNLEYTKALLAQEGRLEAFIENTLVLRGADIEAVHSPRVLRKDGMYGYEVPLKISQEGADRFAVASSGKGNYPLVIYLDRPDDAVVLFDEQLQVALPSGFTYDSSKRMFHVVTQEPYSYDLLVTCVPISRDNISDNTRQMLEELRSIKSRVILLGSPSDFSENVTGDVRIIFGENKMGFFPKHSETESQADWISRVCGSRSAPAISQTIAGVAAREVEITGARSTEEDARREADELKGVLSQRLPTSVSFVGASSIPARLGSEFAFDVLKAAIAAVIAVGVLVYLRYRRPLIVGAIMLTMGSTLLITLGIASGLRQTIGLPEIGAILAIIGTGVEQQLIITDEVLRRGLPQAGPRPMSLSGRIGKALAVIFAVAATTIAAMATLFFVGYGAMKGFAIIMSVGVLVAILVVLPAYGKIINAIVSREITKAEKTQAKAAQR